MELGFEAFADDMPGIWNETETGMNRTRCELLHLTSSFGRKGALIATMICI